MTDLSSITPGDAVEVDGDRWTVDSIHPARGYTPARLECTRTVRIGPGHVETAARAVTPDQVQTHLTAAELTRF